MGAATVKLINQGGAGGSAAFPVRPDNASRVGGSSQNQGGHASGNTSAQTPYKISLVQITPSASYATGGETVDWTQVGFDSVLAVIPYGLVGRLAANLRVLEYDHANSKAMVRASGGAGAVLPEAANASDQSGAQFVALVYGT